MRVALYARVSTNDQTCENQLLELRRYVAARAWSVGLEFVDTGVSGARDSRPELDRLMLAARRREVDAVICWSLDRLGRTMKHLVTCLEEWQSLGVAFVSVKEGLDYTTPAGRLYFHVMAALAEFERERVRERVVAGIARRRAEGLPIGRPRRRLASGLLASVAGLSVRQAAAALGVNRGVIERSRALSRKPLKSDPPNPAPNARS